MTYSEFMNKPASLHRRILHQADEVMFKFEVCTRITTTLNERVQTSPSNTTERNYVAYIDAKSKLDELWTQYDDAKKAVVDFLYGNMEPIEADLLEWRYVNDKDLQEIAAITGASYKTTRNKMSKYEKKAREVYEKWQNGTTWEP